jgi:hypothetical protein
MRSDLHEVLIERPRGGQRRKTDRGHKPRVGEWTGEDDSYADSYRPRRHRTKYFDDLLSPLRRWLRKQVDRPWDRVWSELAGGIDSRSVVGRHLLDHVRQLVTIDCRYDAQRRRAVHSPHRTRGVRLDGEVTGLFVDPRTRILRWRKPPSRRAARRREPEPIRHPDGSPADLRRLSPARQALKLCGIWYEVGLAELPAEAGRNALHDLKYQACRYVITGKRQLGSRELSEAKLSNDA